MKYFKEELLEIELIIGSLDIKVNFAPKGCYKITEKSIKYSWGVLRILLRKDNTNLDNNKRVNTLMQYIKSLLHKIPVETE